MRFPSPPSPAVKQYQLGEIPQDFTVTNGRAGFKDVSGNEVILTIRPELQAEGERLLRTYHPAYGVIVAVDPHTGAVLAATGSSRYVEGKTLIGRASFPAASLIKVVTGAAAVEIAHMSSDSIVPYRGGTHLLCPTNYIPNAALDRKRMTLADAMGKSCNPVFAHLALTSLRPADLERYARRFGFNASLEADFPIEESRFEVGQDQYEIARTAAGYEGALISPMHAAMIAATVANGGQLLRPYMIDEVRSPMGDTLFQSQKRILGTSISTLTSAQLIQMMKQTTLTGTARSHFSTKVFKEIPVAGKTGTLKGESPEGLYHWFIGMAPADKPEIAVATLVIENGGTPMKASGFASALLDSYFRQKLNLPPEPRREIRSSQPVVKLARRNGHGKKKTKRMRA